MPSTGPNLTPHRRILGAERTTVTKDCTDRYGAGQSIRSIAADLGRSYGFVHGILTQAEVRLRPRGGARPRPERRQTP